jgi:serine/threonine protein kinase
MISSDLSSVKIIDFGYATPLDPIEFANASKFLKGKLSCTANYMAPELYSTKITNSLAGADIFALGVILINFITGGYTFDSVFEPGSTEIANKKYLSFMEAP